MITVTKPFLPPQKEYNEYINGIWDRNWLTNHGILLREFEKKLRQYLNLSNILFVGNGTIALQLAIKALELKGEIITTAFSHVSTTSSIVWEGCKPVFVDIDKHSLNINADKIEDAITENTSAILATHVFGRACDIEEIEKIAKKYKLKVIYDGAHAFGVKYKGKSIFGYGDISTTSFHATKLFHATEGGGVFSSDKNIHDKIELLGNFGHTSSTSFDGVGINAKNCEFHAAMGLCNIQYIDEILAVRKRQYSLYEKLLKDYVRLPSLHHQKDTDYNYAYFAAIFENEPVVLRVKAYLESNNIYSRRYFYPSLSTLNYVEPQKHNTPLSNDISSRILCLPLYHDLSDIDIKHICKLITTVISRNKNISKKK